MNRILIAGHPTSGYQEVECVLQQCGMNGPLRSRREGLLPQEITSTLCKVYQRPQADRVSDEHDIEQLQVASVWHGMALDLMLGNLEQKLWGWADPQAIYTLDYWKQLDDKLTFVLVYDEPQLALMRAATQQQNMSTPELEQLLSNWMAYNGALLRFYLRNSERCLLVNSQQVHRNSEDYLLKLQPLLSAELLSLPANETPVAESASNNPHPINMLIPAQKLTDIVSLAGLETKEAQEILQCASVERYLVDQLIAEYPACLQLYAELQSAASLPQKTTTHEAGSPIKAWEALVRQRTLAIELASGLHEAYQEINLNLEQVTAEQARETELRLSQLHQVQEELKYHCLRKQEFEQNSIAQASEIQRQAELVKQKEAENSALDKALTELEAHLESTQSAGQQKLTEQNAQLKSISEENELLLSQLHRVQGELEYHYLHKVELEQHNTKQLNEIQQQAELTKQKDAEKSALDKALTEAQTKLKAAQSAGQQQLREQDVQLRAIGEENNLLLSQLHQVQNELERYYQENQNLKAQLPVPLYGAAQRVKEELSYRLGAVMIKRSHSLTGWLGMPWALIAERRAWHQHNSAHPQETLPSIDTYSDAYEAERVKRHLSYRLGQSLIRNGKSPLGWVKLPFSLSSEVRQFRIQRKES